MDFSFLCFILVFAHLSESHVVILGDYEDAPSFVRIADSRSRHDENDDQHQAIGSSNKPKRTHGSKKTVLHYGRHIYHLDNFLDKKFTRDHKPEPVAYNYADLHQLIRTSAMIKGRNDYLKDVVIFSESPIHICNGKQCDEDLRKFSRFDRNGRPDRDRGNANGRLKRFQIVDNREKPETESSEGHYEKKKPKKNKKKKHSSESVESKESSSEEQHKKKLSTHKKKKPKDVSNSESSEETTRKPKKKYESDSNSASDENDRKNDSEDSGSDEEFRTNNEKRYPIASTATKRKTFKDGKRFFVQGSKIFLVRNGKHDDSVQRRTLEPGKMNQEVSVQGRRLEPGKMNQEVSVQRRRLEPGKINQEVSVQRRRLEPSKINQEVSVQQKSLEPGKMAPDVSATRKRLDDFLPKRYHWDPDDMHELGYFWFNGPKGMYPAPRLLPPVYGKK